MKKYKVHVIYNFVGGTNITLVEDYECDNIDTEFISKLIDSMVKAPYNSQTRDRGGTSINMANVTYIEIDVKEVEDE
jgi:hypothetical protein